MGKEKNLKKNLIEFQKTPIQVKGKTIGIIENPNTFNGVITTKKIII